MTAILVMMAGITGFFIGITVTMRLANSLINQMIDLFDSEQFYAELDDQLSYAKADKKAKR
jgi:hypothetical protein